MFNACHIVLKSIQGTVSNGIHVNFGFAENAIIL